MNKDILKITVQKNLEELSEKFQLSIPKEIILYISSVIALYYKGIPFYLIDISEKDPFRLNKIRGDISLILVGLFREWVNRKNRPLKPSDYINAGKLSYFNAYVYLESNYGELFYKELNKDYIKTVENIYSYIDIFKSLSEEFETYTDFLNIYKREISQMERFFDTFPELKLDEFKRLFRE